MQIIVYSDVPEICQAFLNFLADEPALAIHVASDHDGLRQVLTEFDIAAVVVPRVSIPAWWDCEEQLTLRIGVPRIVATVVDPGWHPQHVADLGFDGHINANLAEPPYKLARDFIETVRAATTRGTRPPLDRAMLIDYPNLDTVTDGDDTNRKILALLAIGREDREIAGAVCLSRQTVRNRVSNMLGVSGMKNRTQLAVFYVHRMAQARSLAAPAPPIHTKSIAT
jgi:DNA-binding NarL/FixJ family response regulator